MSSAELIIALVAEGIGVASQIADLAQRVKKGETITDAEIDEVREAVSDSVASWDAAAKYDTE